MAADEAAQSSAAETDAPENALSLMVLQLTPKPAVKEKYFLLLPIFFFFFLGAHILGLFVNLTSELFPLNFGNNTICPVFMGC